jgi:type I restriction-modification system DNA methylase subunit
LSPADPAVNGSAGEEAKSAVAALVEKYRNLSERGKLGEQNEAEVRTRFITPLLRALGWDVEGLDEVHPEQRTLTGFADYGLKLPTDKRARIFVEAKPFDLGPAGLDGHTFRGGKRLTFAQQAIQYAWQMQASWAILTNFAETRLYTSYVDPKSPDEGLVLKLTWDQYLDRFDELWRLSKDATAEGRLDALETKRTRQTIHEEAPADLFECREVLVTDVHVLNPKVSLKEVQEAVQRTLDRLIVIRVAEDRLILPSEALWKLYNSWRETQIDSAALFVSALKDFFQQFDRIYNSEMFTPGHVCERVNISNDAVAHVLGVLYDYNFDLIDADILGSIYEGYLGYVLREEKGELKLRRDEGTRKKTGVYYTPTYVVEYIVDRAVGPLLGRTDPAPVMALRILDPACGSGSFLIKAFDRVSAWYEQYNHMQRQDAKGRSTLLDHEGRKHEVYGFRERILHENLYGVDLDPQAAEIAAINLMLKGLRKGQKLPLILKENVRVGNSLISGHEAELKPYFGEAWKEKNPFVWNEEFPFAGETGGFDAVIGNPPYVDSKTIPEDEREYFHDGKHGRALPFPAAYKKTDLYALFVELGVRLLKPGGRLSFIIPNRFLYMPYATKLRELLLDTCVIEEIVDLSNVRVFPHQSVWNIIIVVRKEPDPGLRHSALVRVGVVPEGYPIADGIPAPTETMDQSTFRSIPEFQFRLNLRDAGEWATAQKIERTGVRLEDVCYVNWGIRTGTDDKTRSTCSAPRGAPGQLSTA